MGYDAGINSRAPLLLLVHSLFQHTQIVKLHVELSNRSLPHFFHSFKSSPQNYFVQFSSLSNMTKDKIILERQNVFKKKNPFVSMTEQVIQRVISII